MMSFTGFVNDLYLYLLYVMLQTEISRNVFQLCLLHIFIKRKLY